MDCSRETTVVVVSSATTVSASMMEPVVVGVWVSSGIKDNSTIAPAPPLESHPSSCHRTRSAVACSVRAVVVRQTLEIVVPSSVSAAILMRTQFSPCAASCWCTWSASIRAIKAASSTRVMGSSGAMVADRSSSAASGATLRCCCALAMRWQCRPALPKRVLIAVVGSSVSSPKVEIPKLARVSTVSF